MNIMEVKSESNQMVTGPNKSSGVLGKEEFLKILATQLKCQDPLNPMDDKDFITQMAQFSALEQMTNLNSSFELSRAIGLIGKEVVAYPENFITGDVECVTGTVECVYSDNGIPLLKIGNHCVYLDSVKIVRDKSNEE
jgi:flagellar basal-body rod modification protein FlgD